MPEYVPYLLAALPPVLVIGGLLYRAHERAAARRDYAPYHLHPPIVLGREFPADVHAYEEDEVSLT